jgi:UDP-N-acetyl-D-mannosaminuronic acid transferase (WecB/TagA/CpsF family)
MDKKNIEHTHDNGITHSHENGDVPHTHDIPKIDCTTITTYRNTKTGETFKEKVEGPDIVEDVTVQVTNKGLQVFQKVMNQKNDKPKS